MKCKIVARAAYDYEARTDEEITIREGTVLLVLDDSDPDWWQCKEHVSGDAFQDGAQGLAPVIYLEEMEPILVATTLYDYDARTDEEISFAEGVTALVYENSDPDWWFVRIDKDAGLVPATYLEASSGSDNARPPAAIASVSAASAGGDALDQKNLLLNTLDMFGVQKTTANKVEKEKAPPDVKLIPVFELDKKKKKEKTECVIGIGNDYVIYLCEPIFSNVLEKWDYKQLSKFHEKKGKKVTLEFGSDVREYEGEKDNLEKLMKRLEEVKTLSKVSGPILTGPPPNMGPPEGSLKFLPAAHDSPPPAPVFTAPPPAIIPATQASPRATVSNKTAIALYDYEATNDEELTIREDDELIVLDSSDDDWWSVRLANGRGEGLVPKTYVELKSGASAAAAAPARASTGNDNRRQQQEEEQRRRQEQLERQQREAQERQLREAAERRQHEADRRRQEDLARQSRMDEERRRHEAEAQKAPILMARPPAQSVPAAAQKKSESSTQISIPSAVPRLPERPVERPSAPVSKPAEEKKAQTEKPNPARIRKWVDKSGGFTVEAEFLGIHDNKVQLHKVNGVKIAVPLEKLAASELEHIRTIPGYENLNAPAPVASVGIPTPGAARARPGATLLPASSYMYNGFDWRDWLLRAGIASSDASEYALAFVREKLDKSVLDGVDRDVLKALGISEGDIIRIRKFANTGVGSGGGNATANRTKDMSSSDKIDQMLADEQYARQLQEQELHGTTGTTSALLKGNRGRPTGAGINSQSILAASQLLANEKNRGYGSSQTSPAQSNVNPWAGQNGSSSSGFSSQNGSNNKSVSQPASKPVSPQINNNVGVQSALLQQQKAQNALLSQQQQLLTAQQQQALSAQKQAEAAALQLQQQRALAEQQTQLAARKAAELEQQKRQLELARVEAEKSAQLKVMRDETARLEAQLAEQKRLAALRPMQPPLIPTPQGGPATSFVPVGGVARGVPGMMTPGFMSAGPGGMMPGQMGMMPNQQGMPGMMNGFQSQPMMMQPQQPQQAVNPSDRYAALKGLDPLSSSSVFSSAGSSNTGSAFGGQQPQQSAMNMQGFGSQMGMMGGGMQQQQQLQTPQQQQGMMGGMGQQQPNMMMGMGQQQPGMMGGFQSMPMQPNMTGSGGGMPMNNGAFNTNAGGMMPGANLTPQQLMYLQQQQQQQQQFGR
ncbi:cytoskeletal protein binding protein [Chytriomyces hyalinus]|nr:cytoskeletal protein binding protein [Chytriomyces hyalinus]